MNPYPPADDPSGYPATTPPVYVDPVTGQQLYVDPITGSLTYPGQFGTAPMPTAPMPGPMPGAYPAYGYPAYGYAGYGASPYAYPTSRATNGLAIGSMVVSIVGIVTFWCYGIGGLLGLVGAILGHVSFRQVRSRDENGRGMAIAGVVIGWISVAFTIAFVVLIGWAISQIDNSGTDF